MFTQSGEITLILNSSHTKESWNLAPRFLPSASHRAVPRFSPVNILRLAFVPTVSVWYLDRIEGFNTTCVLARPFAPHLPSGESFPNFDVITISLCCVCVYIYHLRGMV